MDTVSWVLTGTIGVLLALYFIFTFAKKIELIQKISSSLLFPVVGALGIYYLLNFIPDSFHIIKLSFLSFLFLSISYALNTFFSKQEVKIVARVSFLISLLPWGFLYKSVFLIHKVPTWIIIISASLYAVLFFLLFIIFVRKASIRLYVYGIITLIFTGFINYCSILLLCYSPSPFSIIRFLGTFGFMAYTVFELLNNSRINLKLKKLISLMILLASLILIILSNLMIFY